MPKKPTRQPTAVAPTRRKPTRKQPRCRWCDAGNVPANGEHWIVKSLVPARITIKACRLAKGAKK